MNSSRRLCIHTLLPREPQGTGNQTPHFPDLSSNTLLPLSAPQTSTSVMRPSLLFRSASTHAASTRMAHSAVSAALDSHPPTSRTTACLPGLGPEPGRPPTPPRACACGLPAVHPLLPACAHGHGEAGQTEWTTDAWMEVGTPFTAPATLSPSYRCRRPGPGPVSPSHF